MTSTSTACKNCRAALSGHFCQNCGQKADIHRVTFKHLLHDFFHAITHADKGFLFLIKQLTFRPGYVAKEYLEGKRKKFFNPLTFYVISSAIWALAVSKSHYFESMSSGQARGGSGQMPVWMKWLGYYFSQSMPIIIAHGKIISLVITAPLLAFLTWIFFRKQRNNYAEHLLLHTFLAGQALLAMVIIFIPVFLLLGYAKMNNNVYQGIFMVYLAFAYQQFFKNHAVITILKTIVIQILFMILFWVPMFAFVFVRDLFLNS